jgi:hypothetical protein
MMISKISCCFSYLGTFREFHKLVWFLCLRFRQQPIERAMDLADIFTWQDLPTRDSDTGQFTTAGWISRINTFSKRIAIGFISFLIQASLRIVSDHETIFVVWYPFDWTVSPYYELANISQVTMSLHQEKSKFS